MEWPSNFSEIPDECVRTGGHPEPTESSLSKPKVLAVPGDSFALRELKLEMPLSNLPRHGPLSGYFTANEFLSDLPDDYCFDVGWL
jgi:hypothetical protein